MTRCVVCAARESIPIDALEEEGRGRTWFLGGAHHRAGWVPHEVPPFCEEGWQYTLRHQCGLILCRAIPKGQFRSH